MRFRTHRYGKKKGKWCSLSLLSSKLLRVVAGFGFDCIFCYGWLHGNPGAKGHTHWWCTTEDVVLFTHKLTLLPSPPCPCLQQAIDLLIVQREARHHDEAKPSCPFSTTRAPPSQSHIPPSDLLPSLPEASCGGMSWSMYIISSAQPPCTRSTSATVPQPEKSTVYYLVAFLTLPALGKLCG